MKPKPRYRFTRLFAACLVAGGVLGLVLQFTVRDRVAILAPAFYGLPPLAVVVILAVACGLAARSVHKLWTAAIAVVLALAIFAWIRTDYVRSKVQPSAGDSIKIAFWNICRPSESRDGFVPALQRTEADIVLLAESGNSSERRRKFWASHFPDYEVCLLGGGLTLLSRYRISHAVMHDTDYTSRFGVYDLETPSGAVSVVAADLVYNPLVRRQPLIDRAYQLAVSKPHPVIVLGDFNTPHTSVFFDDFYRSFGHAFTESGNGLITTWPAFLPLLALDHVWLSKHFVPVRTSIKRTWHSDHGLVVAEARLKEQFDEQGCPLSSDQ